MGYFGIPTFMRQPVSREFEKADVVIMGIPFDGGATSFRSGSRFGPQKIRESSLILWGYNNFLKVAPSKILKIVDYGDVKVAQADIEDTMRNIEAEVGEVLDAGPTVIALGGDHSITLPILRAYRKKFGPIALVQFDAHTDTEKGKFNHGTPFRRALEEELIDQQAYLQVGIRAPTVSSVELQEARGLGAKQFTIDECFEMGMPGVVQEIRNLIGERRVYISLDIDSVDPAYAPGTGTPEVGGFTSYQILQLVRGLQGLNFVGFDVVEVSPPYDNAEITSILAANLVFEFLSLLAKKKQTK